MNVNVGKSLYMYIVISILIQVRGGFTVTKVPAIIARRKDLKKVKQSSVDDNQESGTGQWLLVNPTSLESKVEEKVDDHSCTQSERIVQSYLSFLQTSIFTIEIDFMEAWS